MRRSSRRRARGRLESTAGGASARRGRAARRRWPSPRTAARPRSACAARRPGRSGSGSFGSHRIITTSARARATPAATMYGEILPPRASCACTRRGRRAAARGRARAAADPAHARDDRVLRRGRRGRRGVRDRGRRRRAAARPRRRPPRPGPCSCSRAVVGAHARRRSPPLPDGTAGWLAVAAGRGGRRRHAAAVGLPARDLDGHAGRRGCATRRTRWTRSSSSSSTSPGRC